MKALDVTDLHSGIEEIQAKIEVHIEQLAQIEESVTAIVGLSDSLKGEGGSAIRRFFQEGHVPLLTFLKLSLTQYNKVLSQMKASLHSLEPAANGRILESFLEGDLEQSLRQVELVTANLTNQTNAVMHKVSDIVTLPPLRDDEVKHYVQKAKREKGETIEHLHQFDYEQVSSLESVEADVYLMERYVQELQAMFQVKGSNVSTHLTNQLTYNSFYLMLNSKLAEKQTQNTQLFKQMYSQAYAINTTMTQAVTFDKWTNPSCPRPAHVNKAVAAEPERNWFQKAGDQIVSGAKTVGKAAKDHSREIGSTFLDFTPIVGNIKAGVEAKSGVDPITKRELEDWEKYFAAAGILTGGLSKLGSKAVKGVKGVDGKAINKVEGMPPIVQSRINISNDGWEHVRDRHFSNKNASQFTITQGDLRSLLSSKTVVDSPVTKSIDSGDGVRYVREVTLDNPIGRDKFNNFQPTSTMTILTDKHGNLVTATPGRMK
ncbi:T7SS effector LXG polymorphic toxin [Alkalihalophilus marmarensis]|jgi:predicted ribonuclease toxin of YeeF-YezG toxin-antitoxin module|uniref:T7SS effector LXG polymorphic toxin n=1 Tax=Alkalihalophilus marmarensis TaxID=521377 RepID=UPI00203A462F|nr:T7SS effector LXG polymorphic toxin [Alkalihalophilus marmarensis]MCM3490002.1 T7SS effector LXG polymorphic toxin [Alkalihalophilus marmarensis]